MGSGAGHLGALLKSALKACCFFPFSVSQALRLKGWLLVGVSHLQLPSM